MLTFEKIREMRYERRKLWEEAKQLVEQAGAKGRDLTPEEEERWQKIDAEIQRLTKLIEREERLLDLQPAVEGAIEATAHKMAAEGEERAASRQEPEYSRVFVRYLLGGMDALEPEERSLLQKHRSEVRAQGTGSGAIGGYLVPEEFQRELEKALQAFTPVRQVARVIRTASGAPLQWPTVDDTSNVGELLGENTATTEQDVAFGQVTLNAYIYSSKAVRVSNTLLQDSAFAIEELLRDLLSERIGRILNQHLTTGTGTGQPQGVVTGAQQGKVGATGQTTSVTYDDLVDLIHSVDAAYRSSTNARFMLHDSTLAALKKLKDDQGQPIWLPGVAVREPDTILGFRYVINNDMPTMEASAKSILFGDFSKYIVREVMPITISVSRERYMEYFQTAFFGYARFDGRLIQPAAIKYYQNSDT